MYLNPYRKFQRRALITTLLVLLALAYWQVRSLNIHGSATQAQPVQAISTAASQPLNKNISFLAQPRLSAAFINRVLAAYHSPAAGLGAQIYNLGQQSGVNSDLLLGIFGHESLFGTTGEAHVSRSVGNLRCLDSSYAPYHTRCANGYAQFPSWLDGIGAFYRLLKVGYIDGLVTVPIVGHRCTTLAQVIPVWAPVGDGNDPGAYIGDVLTFLHTWYTGGLKP
jgi:hypothetical protein